MVRDLHEAGIEVILDVVYNHTAEGNHLGPTLSMRGIDNRALLPGRGRPAGVLHGLHRHRQHAERAAPAHAAADHGLAALLGAGDARRRLPLRPRRHAGPRVLRRRPAERVLRPGPAGPDRLPGEADRRAVGRRAGRLPGRQLPAAVDGVERQVPRHRPRLLARRAGHARRVRLPAHRLARPVRARRPAAVREHQLRHRARRLHPATTWSRTTRSTTRPTARTTATARATTGPGTAASRATPTTSRCWSCAPSSGATSSPPCSSPRACRCCCTATRWAAPSAATTTPTARTTRSPGWTGRASTSDLLEFTATVSPAAPRAPGLPAAPVLRRPAGAARRRRAAAGHRLVHPGRRRDDRGGLGGRLRQVGGGVPQRRRHPRTASSRGERVTDDSFILIFNAHDGSIDFTLPGAGVRREVGGRARHRRPRSRPSRRWPRRPAT